VPCHYYKLCFKNLLTFDFDPQFWLGTYVIRVVIWWYLGNEQMGSIAYSDGLPNEEVNSSSPPQESGRLSDIVRWLLTVTRDDTLPDRGIRLLMTALSDTPQEFALTVAREIVSTVFEASQSNQPHYSQSGAIVMRPVSGAVLIDTSQGALSLSPFLQLARSPGLAELCQFRASFEDVIQRDPFSQLHFLASGKPRSVGGAWGKPGAADRVFRALDASYRHVIFCAELAEALLLTNNLKRQFSAAIVVDFSDKSEERIVSLLESYGFPVLIVRAKP
jgi:hypothetical protein